MKEEEDIELDATAPPALEEAYLVVGASALSSRKARVRELLPQKQLEVAQAAGLRDRIRATTPEFQPLKQAQAALAAFSLRIGLDSAILQSSSSSKHAGRDRNSRGKGFERTVAEDVLPDHLLPIVAQRHCVKDPSELFVLRNVKLGTAGIKGITAELDCLICAREKETEGEGVGTGKREKGVFCKVLAVVEVKRNIDDLGEAFISYQRTLNWLAGIEVII
jgi:hypothetical protein